ncbi:MAG: NAD-dependent epimerase [Sulfurimonas sp.]|uniref:NAD-dependent epimerase n=1 Tax=Sulfurimonas sp. TaxID=2022749 RepID=UPI00260BE445|nr:NAD-dependent epimerase [Sulfurimonas sp.]MDD5400405.1 NAD-dependent epimerase [Sulfurimonas sp.]
MKILVTGTAGFIGFHLAKKLLERGDEVVGLDNINDYYDVNLKYARLNELGIQIRHCEQSQAISETPPHRDSHCERSAVILSSKYPSHKFVKMDLADTQAINKLFETEKFDAVCNLAAQAGVRYSIENPHAYIQSNVVGFMNILEACRHFGVKNLAYASSSSVYGLNRSQPFRTSDHTDHPISLYAATKKSNEMMAHTYSHLYGIATTGLRFFTVYGEWGRPDMAPMLFADAILNDRAIKVFNHGNMSRDFTYIDDIVGGVIKVIDNPAKPLTDLPSLREAKQRGNLEHPEQDVSLTKEENLPSDRSTAPYRIYNIGNNSPVQLLDFIKTLEISLQKEAKKNFMDMQDGDVVSTYADISALIDDFGYKPDTSLEVGVEKFVKWYKKFYNRHAK